MTRVKISRRQFQRTLIETAVLAGGTVGCVGLIGCSSSNQAQQTNPEGAKSDLPKASTVPLRIWIVGSVSQPETIIRQWNASSEQPIDIRSLTSDELMSQSKCAADLLLYPSRLIGELYKRQWIVKLPGGLSKLAKPQLDQSAEDEDLVPALPALLAASSYDGTVYGLPLGYSMINLIGSATVNASTLTWQQLQDFLSVDRKPLEFDESRVDKNALVDRFFSIAFGNTSSNAKYGVLFDIHSLKARLSNTEFLLAGNLLHSLACQPDAAISVVGSHSTAWQWITQLEQPGFALVSASQLDTEASQIDSAQFISLDASKPYNDGGGVVGSVTSQCQQTAQVTQFLRWIYQPKTLEALRCQVAGMINTTAKGRTLIDRIVAANGTALQADNVITEPRMPGTEGYRAVLAEHLLDILRGKAQCQEALAAANEDWNRLTSKAENAKFDYEQSLGLRI